MEDKKSINRRKWFKVALGGAGASLAGNSLAQACRGIVTARQPLGPFFPKPGTPEWNIRERNSGPVYHANDNDLTVVKGQSGTAAGQVVFVRGKVVDESCNPISRATIVMWQASESGRYNHKGDKGNPTFTHPVTGKLMERKHDPNFTYWGRFITGSNGEYWFKTIIPGFYPANLQSRWYRPPHLHFRISSTRHRELVTQTYFKGREVRNNKFLQDLNAEDYLLNNLSGSEIETQTLEFVRSNRNSPEKGELMANFDITLRRR